MRRANSTLSIHKIQSQWDRTNTKRSQHHRAPSMIPSCQSQSYLMQRTQPSNKQQKRKGDDRVYCLQKEIVGLEEQISSSKGAVKNYGKELAQYQQFIQHMQQLQTKKANHLQKMGQLKNQLCMMQQQRHSTQYNADERVAEKQYFQQLIASYKRQYQQQSDRVMQLIQLEQQAVILAKSIEDIQHQIKQTQDKLKQWKQQTCYELNQHKIRNSIKFARIELIRLQDRCDAHCMQYKLKTIRQLCCQFFKLYAKKNGVGLEQAEDGPDLYFCRAGVVDQYRQYLSQRIIYNKPWCKQFDQYFDTLLSIQKIYSSTRNKTNNNTHSLQMQQLNGLKQLKQHQTTLLNQCRSNIAKTNIQIDKQFGLDSLAVIQYLRERNNNKYDIKQIKSKLKQNKKELGSRIANIKQAYHAIKHLECVIRRDMINTNRIPNQASINCIRIEIKNQQEILSAVEMELQKYNRDKDNLQTYITNAVSKWRERQEKKDKLKELYNELEQTKQTNNYALTRNQQPKQQPVVIEKTMGQSTCSNKLVRRDSSSSLLQSKSVLAFSNPFKNIMDRQTNTNTYQPIIQDCQLILSKQLIRHKHKPSNNLTGIDTAKKSNVFSRSQKQNYCENKSAAKSKSMLMSQTNYTMSAKPSITLQSNNKRKQLCSQKQSLSKLLLSKFNR